jgi:hypothetical protein
VYPGSGGCKVDQLPRELSGLVGPITHMRNRNLRCDDPRLEWLVHLGGFIDTRRRRLG